MARIPRVVLPDVPLHVIQRGHNRSATFRSTGEFERYRELLCEMSVRHDCAIHAYTFMSNHAHILLTPKTERGPARMMQAVGQQYVRFVNARYERTGTLWEGRFKSSLVESARYVLTCMRYIELNAVRARMVDSPEQYRWSSYGHHAMGIPDALVTSHALYDALGGSASERQVVYRSLCAYPLASSVLEEIRTAGRRQNPLGDDRFCTRVERRLRRRVVVESHGGARRGNPRGGAGSDALHAPAT